MKQEMVILSQSCDPVLHKRRLDIASRCTRIIRPFGERLSEIYCATRTVLDGPTVHAEGLSNVQ